MVRANTRSPATLTSTSPSTCSRISHWPLPSGTSLRVILLAVNSVFPKSGAASTIAIQNFCMVSEQYTPPLQLRQDSVDLVRTDIKMRRHPYPALARRRDDFKLPEPPGDGRALLFFGIPESDDPG